jgi:hypothetical protein
MSAFEPAWSMESYRLRRAALLLRIAAKQDGFRAGPHQAPVCAHCGTTKGLQVHHPEGNGDSHGIGGWRQLRKIEIEEKAGIPLELLCKKDHVKEHDNLHLGELPGGFHPPEGGEI